MGTLNPTFPVVDIFESLQGEGMLAGVPSVFVRLAGCPLRCPWCDTKSAWSPDDYPRLSCRQIVDQVGKFACPNVVVTGGEPLMHPQAGRLVDLLRAEGWHVTVETSGIFHRTFRCQLVSISPKLRAQAGSQTGTEHFRPSVLKHLIRQSDDYQLKFVVETYAQVRETIEACRDLTFVDRSHIMLMPRARTRAAYLRIAPKVARWAIKHNLRFSPRLQLVLGIK